MWSSAVFVLLYMIGYSDAGAPVVVGIPPGNYLFSEEEQDVGTVLFTFTAHDPDGVNQLSVEPTTGVTTASVGFNTTGLLHNITVKVVTKQRLDREQHTKIELKFAVIDNVGNSIPVTVDIYLEDINDNAPEFQNMPYRWDIPELPCNLTSTYHVTATDADTGANAIVRYYLKANAQADSTKEEYEETFKINNISGVVSLDKCLNFSVNSYYQFTVMATDAMHTTTADFIVRVLDVQNLPPFFIGVPYRTEIEENIPVNTLVRTVVARDGDTGLSNDVTYSIIEAGQCYSLFNISASGGDIMTSNTIDRDVAPLQDGICTLQILAQEIDTQGDQHGETNSTTDVTITVLDLNDNSPKFGNSTYQAEIQEKSAHNLPITLRREINVADADADIANTNMELSLSFTNGSDCDDFEVVPSTVKKESSLVIRVNNSELLDYEQVENITILIVATETNNANHTDTATVTITVIDMNDNNPQFLSHAYEFNISESTANQTAGFINATDKDSGLFGLVAYTLYGGNNRFAINRNTGEVTTNCNNTEDCASKLDREVTPVFYLTVTATDMNGTSGGRSNSTSVVINLLDVNDNAPVFTRPSPIKLFVEENDSKFIETALVKVEARDNDEKGTPNSEVWYSIIAISEDNLIENVTINNMTGELFLTHAIDFEELEGTDDSDTTLVQVVIAAFDKGIPAMSNNITIDIEVQDKNDKEPQFNATTFDGSVYENKTSSENSSAYVGQVFATDNDGSKRNKDISYYIISGSSDRFRINSSSGEVSVQLSAALDRETVDAYNITIYAIDHGSPPLTGTTVMNVKILDVNDESPKFNQTTYAVSVTENSTDTLNKTIIKCPADDPDLDADLSYSVLAVKAEGENGNSIDESLVKDYFGISSSSGSVYVKSMTDRETAETITLTLLVEDLKAFQPNPQNATAVLTITLLDINDNTPTFEETNYTMAVSENALDNTRLESVQATDRDKNRTITYSLAPGPSPTSSFRIENKTGTIIKDGDVDRETNATIELVAIATDDGVPSLSSSVIVTIVVIDFNDNAPEFLNNITTTVNVLENIIIGTSVILVTADDKDEGPNAEIKYSFNGEYADFKINDTTGLITTSQDVDRERVDTYILQVVATDQPKNNKEQKSSMITLTINILDVNDNHPVFDTDLYKTSVREDATVTTSVITLRATDRDAGVNAVLKYMFENDTDPTGMFAIDEVTGVVTVNISLKDHAGVYFINVTAQDQGEQSLSNSTILSIEVTDVNLHKPVIVDLPKDNLLKEYECARVGYELYPFNYTDADRGRNAEADFNISKIQDDISVFIMHANGSLRLEKKLNYTVKHEYQFQVQAIDRGIPALPSDKVTITVKVIDVNDHLPSFPKDNVTLHVEENRPNSTYVGKVTAVDPDSDSLSCYTKSGKWADNFTVGNNTGEIWTRVEFDHEELKNVSFYIEVKDCSIMSNTSTACDNATDDGKHDDVIAQVLVNVMIDDVNDNPPVFEYEEIVTGMRRTTEVGTVLELKLKGILPYFAYLGYRITRVVCVKAVSGETEGRARCGIYTHNESDPVPKICKDKEYVMDNDSDKHGISAWKFANNGTVEASPELTAIGPESGTAVCKDSKKHIFCIAENGSITNNRYFSEDLSGYFLVQVRVYDSAGFDRAKVRIYLIGDEQILKMVLFGAKEMVSLKKDEILQLYTNITGHTFVYGGIEDHKTAGGLLDTSKTDLFFHVVEPDTQRILSTDEAIRLIDGLAGALQEAVRKHSVIEVVPMLQSGSESDNKERTIYILAAVVAALAVTVIIIVYVAVSTRLKYQNKLKAATVTATDSKVFVAENPMFVPGSNQYSKQSNPLLNSELPLGTDALYDSKSLNSNNSLDENEVGETRDNSETIYDTMEEREVTMDIYEENPAANKPEESPLDAALRMHSIQSGSSQSKAEKDGDVGTGDTSPEFVTVVGIDNEAFIGDLESTEI